MKGDFTSTSVSTFMKRSARPRIDWQSSRLRRGLRRGISSFIVVYCLEMFLDVMNNSLWTCLNEQKTERMNRRSWLVNKERGSTLRTLREYRIGGYNTYTVNHLHQTSIHQLVPELTVSTYTAIQHVKLWRACFFPEPILTFPALQANTSCLVRLSTDLLALTHISLTSPVSYFLATGNLQPHAATSICTTCNSS